MQQIQDFENQIRELQSHIAKSQKKIDVIEQQAIQKREEEEKEKLSVN